MDRVTRAPWLYYIQPEWQYGTVKGLRWYPWNWMNGPPNAWNIEGVVWQSRECDWWIYQSGRDFLE